VIIIAGYFLVRDSDALEGWRAVANAPQLGVEIVGGDIKRYNAEDGGPLF
jgi:hypothetical protein